MKGNTPDRPTVITLEAIARLKAEKLKEVQKTKENISNIVHELFTPVENQGGMMGLMQHVNTGIAVYDGVRTGIKIIQRIRSFFRRKK